MKTRTNLCLSLLFALILTGCNKPNPSSNDSLPSDEEASITSEIPPTSEDITSKEEPVTNDGTSSTSEGKDIKSEVLSFLSNTASHGNTNGNANNNGLAVYDHSLTFHYYAVKDRVYKYNPKTNMTYFLFASGDGSYIKHLSLGDSTLYYVTTANNYTYKHDLLANVSSLIYNEETLSIHRYYDNVFLQSNKLYYEVMTTGLGVYDHRTQSLTSKFQPGTNNVNLGWGRIIYNNNVAPTIELRDESFMGRTNIEYFDAQGFSELLNILVITEASNTYKYALLLKNSSETARIKALVSVLSSEKIKNFILETWHGDIIPA